MKRQLRKIRVLLARRYFGNSINAFVIAAAITAALYFLYFAVLIGIQEFVSDVMTFGPSMFIRPAMVNVIFNFFAIGFLFRYATPRRVIRFCLRRIHEVASPWWFAWSQGHRLGAFTPVFAFMIAASMAIAVALVVMPKARADHRSQQTSGLASTLRPEETELFPPCAAVDIDTDLSR